MKYNIFRVYFFKRKFHFSLKFYSGKAKLMLTFGNILFSDSNFKWKRNFNFHALISLLGVKNIIIKSKCVSTFLFSFFQLTDNSCRMSTGNYRRNSSFHYFICDIPFRYLSLSTFINKENDILVIGKSKT